MRNLKKVIALVAVFAMLISTVSIAAFADTFTDVATTDNYAEAIETLSAIGILTGDDENNDGQMEFRPEDTITRAEVTAIISRIQGMNSAAQTNTVFNDVPSDHWASGYIAQASGQGIVNGYGDGNFGPDDSVKYEEMIKMLMETLGYNPYATDNGGYPTGYITAAQRYGVLENVVGGGVGTEAPRGMVAQMVYNAIDTPLMDKYTYGKDASYVIYDNLDTYGYQTLLTRDLKMIKVTGKVVANSYTDLTTGSTSVDTSMDKTIAVRVDNTTNNYNYGLEDYLPVRMSDGTESYRSLSIYQGDVDADGYLGYAVSLYASESSTNDEYTLVAITQNSSRNTSVSFTLDQYYDYEVESGSSSTSSKSTLRYLKNDTDRNATRLNIQANPTVVYNGVAGVALENYFNENVISEDTSFSGKVTVMDTDDISGYDVVVIEIGVSAVVSDISSRDAVRFMTSISFPQIDGLTTRTPTLKELSFDEQDTNIMVNLTKNGEAYDYQELKEWDVLTVLWNGADEVYNARVLDSEKALVSSITSERATSNGGKEFMIDGTWYEEAADCYYSGSKLEPGVSGKFFIDEYGKIVALDKSIQPGNAGTVPTDNYAYVINAATESNSWNQSSIRIQLLDKSGQVYEAYLANNAQIQNPSDEVRSILSIAADDDKYSLRIDELTTDVAERFAKALVNQLVTYAANSSGEVRTIVMPLASGASEFSYATNEGASGFTAEYDEDTMSLGKVFVTEDTYVFYIKGDGVTVTYGESGNVADKTRSSVVKATQLPGGVTYGNIIAFTDDFDNDYASVVVLMNEDGGTSPATNVAVVNSIGTSYDEYNDQVYTVEFYMNGELMNATTVADIDNEDAIANAKRGDVFKFTMDGDTITNLRPYLVFERGSSNRPFEKDAASIPSIATLEQPASTSDEEIYFGAVTKVPKGNSSITLALYDTETKNFDLLNTQLVKESTGTNVYVYDPMLRESNSLDYGSLGDAEIVDDELGIEGYKVSEGDVGAAIDTPAFGMLDYVFARYYNNRAADIVVYKNYDFGSYVIEAVAGE